MDWTHRLRLRNLQMLLSLAQTGNISHSAQALNATQPGLSKWLKDLEEDIGLPLFERHARGLRPTPYGESLIEYARRVDACLDTARDEMEVMRRGGSGLVNIGVSGASSVDTVPNAVLRVLEKVPDAHIQLIENTPERLIEQLSIGSLDIVVGRSDINYQDPEIRSESLYNEPIHLVVRAGHPILALESPQWTDALSYPWALWAKGTPVRNAFDASIAAAGYVLPKTYVESNSATLTTTLLTSSDMIGIASHRPAMRYNKMKILSIVPLEVSGFGAVSVYWRHDAMGRKVVCEMLAEIRHAAREVSKDNARNSDAPGV